MRRTLRWTMAVVLVLGGVTLIGWNMRDPDRAFREPPSVERVVTLKETPQAVQETIKRISADGTIEDVKEDRKGNTTTYEVDVIRDNTKTEYEISADGLVIEQESKKRKS